jgi:hypothetical protein
VQTFTKEYAMAKMQIPISKGKDLFIEIETDDLMEEAFPADAFKEIIFQGLKQVLNRGQSKLSSTKDMEGKQLADQNAALMAKAQETLEAMRAGNIRVTGGKAKTKGVDRQVMTEATRLAKIIIKAALKEAGQRISHIPAKEITAAAKEYLEGDDGQELIAQARETIKARIESEHAVSSKKIDLSKVKADPKLVAKAEAKKKQTKKPGAEVAQRAKPQAPGSHASH